MGQLSFFSAETEEPSLDDLSGVLAARGQSVRSDAGSRVSIIVVEQWRATAIVDAMGDAGLIAEVVPSDEGTLIARTAVCHELDALHRRWSSGAVKAMPGGWVPSPRALRLWTVAAGEREGERYLLGLDAHAPESHAPLATALMRVGIAPTLVGTRGQHPALRIAGKRRLARLAEYVGQPPDGADDWPVVVES